MPRLLTVTPDFPPSVGGIQLLLLRLLEHLPAFEHAVVCRPAVGEPPPFRTTTTRSQTGPRSLAELNARTVSAALRFRPDVILNAHVHTTPGAVAASRICRAPFVTYAFADELTHRTGLTRMATRHSASTIAISRYTEQLVRDFEPRGPVDLIVPGFDQREIARSRDPRPTIVTVARLADRYKGHDVTLDAMPKVLAAVPDAQWLVAGDGPLRAELQAKAAGLGLGRSVHFLGRVDDATRDELLARAWVFTMVSRLPPRGGGGEGFGIVYLEAAYAGVPVVAGNVAGATDAVDDDVTGLLVDPTDADAVADALITILSDPATAGRMGEAGRDWAGRFSWDRQGAAVGAVLQRALDGS